MAPCPPKARSADLCCSPLSYRPDNTTRPIVVPPREREKEKERLSLSPRLESRLRLSRKHIYIYIRVYYYYIIIIAPSKPERAATRDTSRLSIELRIFPAHRAHGTPTVWHPRVNQHRGPRELPERVRFARILRIGNPTLLLISISKQKFTDVYIYIYTPDICFYAYTYAD